MSTEHPTALSRRTLAAGVAWAAPAVAVAAAAPAMAASPCLDFTFATAPSCRWTGSVNDFTYHLYLTICNSCDKPATVSYNVSHLENGSGFALTPCGGTADLSIGATIPAGGCSEPIFLGDFSSTSSSVWIVAFDDEGNELFRAKAPSTDCRNITNPCTKS